MQTDMADTSKSQQFYIERPTFSLRGFGIALLMLVLYIFADAALLMAVEDLAYIYALTGTALSGIILFIYMIPPWYLIISRMHRQPWWQKILAHLIIVPIYSFVWYESYIWLFSYVFGPSILDQSGMQEVGGWIMLEGGTTYIIVFAIIHIIQSLKEIRLKEHQAHKLEELSRKQEIAVLKAQLNPHFLFNTLNSINAMVTKDPQKSRSMISRLSDMLRYSLNSFEEEEVPLERELEFVRSYLELEKERLGDRLETIIDVQIDPTPVRIPPMILQPLVENAIKHGISPREEGGQLSVMIHHHEERYEFTIEDTGQGLPKDFNLDNEGGKGIGLRTINELLQRRYGPDSKIQIERLKPHGTRLQFEIPKP